MTVPSGALPFASSKDSSNTSSDPSSSSQPASRPCSLFASCSSLVANLCLTYLFLISLFDCERYELKIDYVAMDQVCTWSHY
jgi:hypothetical protein